MWFIVSLVYMNISFGVPEILVHKSVYADKLSCQKVSQAYPSPLIKELNQLRPSARRISISCVDRKELLRLKNSNKMRRS